MRVAGLVALIGCAAARPPAPPPENASAPAPPPPAATGDAAGSCSVDTSPPCCCQLPDHLADPYRWGLICACQQDGGTCTGDVHCS
jgi:hypothetical protein